MSRLAAVFRSFPVTGQPPAQSKAAAAASRQRALLPAPPRSRPAPRWRHMTEPKRGSAAFASPLPLNMKGPHPQPFRSSPGPISGLCLARTAPSKCIKTRPPPPVPRLFRRWPNASVSPDGVSNIRTTRELLACAHPHKNTRTSMLGVPGRAGPCRQRRGPGPSCRAARPPAPATRSQGVIELEGG